MTGHGGTQDAEILAEALRLLSETEWISAQANGQIIEGRGIHGQLFSEDVW